MDNEPSPKRQRLNDDARDAHELLGTSLTHENTITPPIKTNITNLASLTEPVSPPATKTARKETIDLTDDADPSTEGWRSRLDVETQLVKESTINIPSPIRLTRVEGLAELNNIDTVSLRDIVGDPLIKECWVFNYLFDVDFLLSSFDEDVRDVVQIKLVHGSWKKDDSNRLGIEDAMKQHKNIKSVTAYMPEAFGTHHSKMIINIRHDDSAQVNILTANMLSRDWRMCQAVWRSPLLPMKSRSAAPEIPSALFPIGSGSRFKLDLMSYLRHYGSRLSALTEQLRKYDFDSVRAALIASVPGRQNLRSTAPDQETLYGWPGLRNALRSVPTDSNKKPHIVMQVSSVASLGAGDTWLKGTFQEALSTTKKGAGYPSSPPKPDFSLVFPTADSIRRSVDGYASGGSVHMKRTSAQAAKQLDYLHPMLCHWAYDAGAGISNTGGTSSNPLDLSEPVKPPIREAGRKRAAPHIKTYIRFTDESMTELDWAMMTSANLSTQAWGAKTNAAHEVRVCSYEIGVVIWPGLWGKDFKMVPVFGKDLPEAAEAEGVSEKGHNARTGQEKTDTDRGEPKKEPSGKLGLRMPYDLPLMPYKEEYMPWCASLPDDKVDWMGRAWPGYEAS